MEHGCHFAARKATGKHQVKVPPLSFIQDGLIPPPRRQRVRQALPPPEEEQIDESARRMKKVGRGARDTQESLGRVTETAPAELVSRAGRGTCPTSSNGWGKHKREGDIGFEVLSEGVCRLLRREDQEKVWCTVEEMQKDLRFYAPLHRIREVVLNSQRHGSRRFACEDEDSHSRVAGASEVKRRWKEASEEISHLRVRTVTTKGGKENVIAVGTMTAQQAAEIGRVGGVLGRSGPAMKTQEALGREVDERR